MKKFVSVSAAALIAAAALTACSPPGEVDSDVKVQTATEVQAPKVKATSAKDAKVAAQEVGAPKFIDCVGTPGEIPDQITLSCADMNDLVKDITWSSITQTEATGTGTRVTNTCVPQCAGGTIVETEDVKVVLSNPVLQSNGLVYTTVTVDGETIPVG